jgi:signal transduction histidine kinase
MNMAQQLQTPVQTLKEESAILSIFMDRPEVPAIHERAECHRSMDQIRKAISKVDGLVRALLRRAGQGEATAPEWIHLHDLLKEELDLMQAEGLLPDTCPVAFNLQAPRDLLFGVYKDFVEVIGHLIVHALGGSPGKIHVRTWGGKRHFRIEVEDDGGPIHPAVLEGAFEPFPDLRPQVEAGGRRPGQGLPACAQLMNAYGGTVQVLPTAAGTLVRLSLPME